MLWLLNKEGKVGLSDYVNEKLGLLSSRSHWIFKENYARVQNILFYTARYIMENTHEPAYNDIGLGDISS
jgi:hypothetical protein